MANIFERAGCVEAVPILATIFIVGGCGLIQSWSGDSQDSTAVSRALANSENTKTAPLPEGTLPDQQSNSSGPSLSEGISLLAYGGINWICGQINSDQYYPETYRSELPLALTPLRVIDHIGQRGINKPPYLIVQGTTNPEYTVMQDLSDDFYTRLANWTRFCMQDNPNLAP